MIHIYYIVTTCINISHQFHKTIIRLIYVLHFVVIKALEFLSFQKNSCPCQTMMAHMAHVRIGASASTSYMRRASAPVQSRHRVAAVSA